MRKFPAFNHFWKFKPFLDFDGSKGPVLVKYWGFWGHHGGHGHWHGKHHHNHGHKKPLEATQENHHKDYSALLLEEARNENGTDNNLDNPDWGSAGSNLLRASYASYADGIGDVYRPFGANPRDISNDILDQDAPMPSSFGNSDLFTYFGQFIDHDIDLTPEGHSESISFAHPDAPMNGFGISRSIYTQDMGDPREYPNVITSYVDASNVYGSDAAVTNLLRADGGSSPYLLAGLDGYLPTVGKLVDLYGIDPTNVGGGPLVAVPGDDMFVAGDVRANENNALTSLHTMWAREHNYQVDKLKEYMPNATGDDLFKAARLIVEAEYQNIVFNEYLPQLLGEENIPDYTGYNSSVNAGVTIEFSTAAYRLGHSQVSSTLHRLDEDGGTADGGHLGLFQAFFNPTQLMNGGIDALVRGLGAFRGQEIDENIVDDVRNLLFGGGQGNAEPMDLGVLNLLRSYDHGVPTLNEVRKFYCLDALDDFDELTSDTGLQMQFKNVYGDIDNVDLWVGGLAEDNYPGSQLGETFHTIVRDQFMAFRDGDRFYFEERMEDHPELLAMIKDTSFADIIVRTTGIDYFQDDAFIAHNRIGGDDGRDILWGTDDHDLMIGFGGRDKLYGKDGDDDLYGGDGNDRLYGGDGRDVIYGEKGDDAAWGGDGDDLLSGGPGNDLLYGQDGNDTIDGGPGKNTMYGGSGADVFVLSDFDGKDFLADYEMQDTVDLTGLFDILDTDGTAGLSQGDVDNALRLSGGDLSARNPSDDLFDTIAHINAAGGGHPFQVTVLVDDDAGTQGTFTV